MSAVAVESESKVLRLTPKILRLAKLRYSLTPDPGLSEYSMTPGALFRSHGLLRLTSIYTEDRLD
eukprot:gene4360-14761_t